MSASYHVEHQTRYVYGTRVSTSQHVAYLRPRVLSKQQVRSFGVSYEPKPSQVSERIDYFGNWTEHFTMLTPHLEMRVTSRSVVEVERRSPDVDPEQSIPWEVVRDSLIYRKGTGASESAQYAYESPYTTIAPELAVFARDAFTPGRPLVAAAVALMHRIFTEFTFEPSSTTIATPVTRVLADRHGVCQDFAHLQISCMRSLGLPARYVSGYLLTTPPPGKPRLVGADASHAWLSVHCPALGWIDLDPTNDLICDLRHITVAWGRDYGDVSPLRGVILGGTQHTLEVGVNVSPLTNNELGATNDER
jgi:transglutaminase-like putative cysteine protease